MVVNYPSPDVPFTRIVEYKHVPNQSEAVKAGKVKGTPGSGVRVSTPGHALTLTPSLTPTLTLTLTPTPTLTLTLTLTRTGQGHAARPGVLECGGKG